MYYPVSDCPGLYSNFGNPLLDLSGNLNFENLSVEKLDTLTLQLLPVYLQFTFQR